jgi:hypothetical protein
MTVRSCSPSPNPQAGGSPLAGCPRLLIQYICIYSPNVEAAHCIRKLRTRHAVVQGATKRWIEQNENHISKLSKSVMSGSKSCDLSHSDT